MTRLSLLTFFLALIFIGHSDAGINHGNANACWTVGSDGWTVMCPTATATGTCSGGDANGTCIVSVSDSTGTDAGCDAEAAPGSWNPATWMPSKPCKTLAAAIPLLRNGKPDFLVLKAGDTWVGQDFGGHLCCAYEVPSGVSATAPMTITWYGTGARPKVEGTSSQTQTMAVDNHNYIAILGIEFYDYTNDPQNGSFITANATSDATLYSGIIDGSVTTSFLIEDCKFSYYPININFHDNLNPQSGITIRRNIVVNSWYDRNGSWGIGIGGTGTLLQQNVIDNNGWSSYFATPTAVAISGSVSSPIVVTWTGNILANGAEVQFLSGGGNISANTLYYVVSRGTDGTGKFRISAIPGGSAINVAGGEPSTPNITWDVPALGGTYNGRIFNHNIYGGEFAPQTWNQNIITNDSSGTKQVGGGTFTYNLFVANPYSLTTGNPTNIASSFTNNVVQGAVPLLNSTSYSEGVSFGSAYDGNFLNLGTFTVSNDIFTTTTSSPGWVVNIDPGALGITVANNIVYNWNVAIPIATTTGAVATFKSLVQGSGYVDNPYTNVPLSYVTSGSGTGLNANITVNGGKVTVVSIYPGPANGTNGSANFGSGYSVNDQLTTSNSNLGGSGSGFSIEVATLAGSTTTPNVICLTNLASCSPAQTYANPQYTVQTYDSQILGGPGTLADFLSQAEARALHTWPTNLSASSVISYIQSGFVSAPPTTTTWNPSDKDPGITLSNGNLTATSSTSLANCSITGYCGVRSIASHSTGKYCYEVVITNLGFAGHDENIGIGDASASLDNPVGYTPNIGGVGNSVGYQAAALGGVYAQQSSIGTAALYSSGNYADVCVDLGATLFWINVNGGNWNNSGTANPATGTGGFNFSAVSSGQAFYAMISGSNDANTVFLTNFGATSYSGTIPSGFSNW